MVGILKSVLNIKSDAHLTVIEEDINQIIWHDGNPTNITNDAILAKQTELQTATMLKPTLETARQNTTS